MFCGSDAAEWLRVTVSIPRQKGYSFPVGKYVVYDPPADDLPYVAVLFLPEQRPRAFLFGSAEEAEAFLTSNAIETPASATKVLRKPTENA
jgi:hypothetical protein